MSYLDMCRVCLSGNVKIHFIRCTPLHVIFENLTSYKLSTKDGRPETVCYICYGHLQKYRRIIDKSQKSEEILAQLVYSGIQILNKTVPILNRGMPHDFCVTPIEAYNSPKYDTQVAVNEELVTVKQEIMRVSNIKEDGKDETVAFEDDTAPCRMCLAGDVTNCIKNTPLQIIYEKLTNNKLVTAEAAGVCYICRWQLIKCRKFITKSQKSEKILTELLRNGIQLTWVTVAALNSRIKVNYVTTPVELNYCVDKCTPVNKHVLPQLVIKLERIKIENYAPRATREQEDQWKCNACAFTCRSSSQLQQHKWLHDPKRRYPCDICNYRLLNTSHLKQHMKTHQFYECLKCDVEFTKQRKYNMHMLLHTAKGAYACDTCGNVYRSRDMQRRHMRKAHPANKYPCRICGAAFAGEQWRDEHAILVHGRTFPVFICDECGKQFKEKAQLRKHINGVHDPSKNYKCDQCEKLFKWKLSLQQHLLIHSGAKPYKCDVCSKEFRYKPSLITHMKLKHGEKLHACTVCDKRFATTHSLKAHVITHAKIKYSCDICNKKYTKKRFLDEHAHAHATGVHRTYTCDQCGKSFSLNGQLKIHMNKHKPKPKKPYDTCPICHEQKSDLRTHMRRHTGERPYACDQCGKAFAASGNLAHHLRQHAGMRLHPCSVCAKRFATNASLQLHMTTHTSGAKPYACEICARAFYLARQLAYHARTHRPKPVYPCERCEKKFRDKRSLDCHVSSTHLITRRYTCDACFKVYTLKRDFIAHVSTHVRAKFACELCEQTFSKISILARHVSKHIRDKMTVCHQCKRKFRRGTLTRHFKMAHGGTTPYACNVCEEGFGHLDGVYSHYLRTHQGERPYICHLCDRSFVRNRGLKKHIKRSHMAIQT